MRDRRWPRITAVLGAAAVAVALLTVPSQAYASDSLARDLALVRHHTAKYHDLDVALADGYHPPHPFVCFDSPEGTMGYHYLMPDRVDDSFDITRPELLIYAPSGDGNLRLVAVEYFKPDADQDLSTDADRPTLFGQPFNGPMPGHEPGMPIHYDLHVWVWDDNPNGMFAQWNPSIAC